MREKIVNEFLKYHNPDAKLGIDDAHVDPLIQGIIDIVRRGNIALLAAIREIFQDFIMLELLE